MIDAAQLNAELVGPGRLWQELEVVATTGSTNADLAQVARETDREGQVLVAAHQRTGRGRFARVWEAPPGKSVAISVLLRPPPSVELDRWLWLPLITGLAVADGLTAAAALQVELKWPNDVLIEGRKVCGILSERVLAEVPAAIIGVGINTALDAAELPVPTATSLRLAGALVGDTEVVAAVLRSLEGWYRRWVEGEDLRSEYVRRCASIGRRVRVQLSADSFVEGVGSGVDQQGRLLVRTPAGEQPFAAGDVVHLR